MKKLIIILWIIWFALLVVKSFSVEAKEVNDYSQEQRETNLAIVKQEIWTNHLSGQINDVKESVEISNVVIGISLSLLVVSCGFFLFLRTNKKRKSGHNVAVFVNCKGERYQVICRCVKIGNKKRILSPFVSPKTGAEISASNADILSKRSLAGCLRQDIFAEQKKQLINDDKIIKIS